MEETTMTAEMLKAMPITQAMLTANIAVNLDEADELVDKLINIPADRDEAKLVFERILNYDPVSYYDKRDISKIVDTKLEEAKYSKLEDDREEIIEDAYDIYDNNRRLHLDAAARMAFDMRMSSSDEDIADIRKQLVDDFDDDFDDYMGEEDEYE